MDFIVVNAYSPYTAIVARPLLHALGTFSSTLHLKVKNSYGEWIEELVGSQSVARQYNASARSGVLGFCCEGHIAIKDSGVIYECGVRRGNM